MLDSFAINLVKHDVIVDEVSFFVLVSRNPVMTAYMALRRNKYDLDAKLPGDIPQSFGKNARPLGFGKLYFSHH
ncbi:hypothetical protein D3C73_1233980 [compost metagenome]